MPQAVSTSNLPGSETTLLSLSWYISYIYGFITLVDKQSNSTLEFESVAAVAMLNNALAGRNRSASDVSRFRLSSVQLRNYEVGYFDPLLWAVRALQLFVGGKCSVVLCLKNRKYGGVSSLIYSLVLLKPETGKVPADNAKNYRSYCIVRLCFLNLYPSYIKDDVCPSVRLSVCLSVCPSDEDQRLNYQAD